MIPFIYLPNLNFLELIIFQLTHTLLHIAFLILLLYGGFYLIYRDTEYIQMKEILKIIFIIEILEFVVIILINYMIVLSAILYVVSPIFISLVDIIAFYIMNAEKEKMSKIKIFLLFLLVFIPTFLISYNLSEFFFSLFGIPNAIVFNI